jgi:protein-S-isoprenylcysteine O-methyltransferase Ste14
MSAHEKTGPRGGRGYVVGGLALVYFIAALEIVIMISPFAFFFYSVFNPILHGLDGSVWTRWLTAFFLPHMIVPPTPFLIALRVLGSIFFIVGALVFLACAAQVYLGKIFRWGIASRGLYAFLRHPQYTGLAMAGIGLTILWPRFLTLMFLAVMMFLYYLLAKDEELRMLRRYGDGYKEYLEKTGMFLPHVRVRRSPASGLAPWKVVTILVALLGGAALVGFGLRAYTVAHLPLMNIAGIDAMSVLPGDLPMEEGLLKGAMSNQGVAERVRSMQASPGDRILAYVVPINYIMQGMIADTGPEWRLFQRHQTFAMISDYVLNPVGHLQGGHMGHAGMMMHDSPEMQRRIIFVEVSGKRPLDNTASDFGINDTRLPRFFVDISLHTGQVLRVQDTPQGTGWGDVPTPMF